MKLALATLLLVGCKSDTEKLLAAHGDKLKAQLDKVAALAPVVEKQPRLAADKWPVTAVKFSRNVYSDPDGNAMWAWSHQLVDACTNSITTFANDNTGSDYIIFSDATITTTGGLLENPRCGVDGKLELAMGIDERAVTYFEGVGYVLVLRPDVKISPQLDRAEVDASVAEYMKSGKGTDVTHFQSGRVAGDALLYDLDSRELVGGFRFDARSSTQVEVRGKSAGIEEMRRDISKNLEAQIAAKLVPAAR